MDFIEHDLKTLLTLMPAPFLQSEIKTLMIQLLSAVQHCHYNWILHRDLKTSNLLMNNRGTIKVADFGLARRYGDPVGLGGMTQLVVTLWYRWVILNCSHLRSSQVSSHSAPEILMGATTYSTAIDIWSVGCIFAELLLKEPLFQAKGEMELISMIFKLLGPPTPQSWPEYTSLPLAKTIALPPSHAPQLRQKFPHVTSACIDLLAKMLTYDPDERITAAEALQHPYFRWESAGVTWLVLRLHTGLTSESPAPKHPDLFSSFPSVAAGEKWVQIVLSVLNFTELVIQATQKALRQSQRANWSRGISTPRRIGRAINKYIEGTYRTIWFYMVRKIFTFK